jgi:SAM-dependent methyltransferase
MDRDDPAYRGQSDYNRILLRLYDPLVLGPIARYVWRFPIEKYGGFYPEHIRPNHLDVGPGTRYFLEHAGLPDGSKVTILDPNPNVLRHVERRLRHLDVTAVEADVLKPLPMPGPFDSAAMSMVLHCLPGPMERKAQAIENVARVLAPRGVLFGASVLGPSAPHTRLGRAFLWAFNRRGSFGNLDDTEEGLRHILCRCWRPVRPSRWTRTSCPSRWPRGAPVEGALVRLGLRSAASGWRWARGLAGGEAARV